MKRVQIAAAGLIVAGSALALGGVAQAAEYAAIGVLDKSIVAGQEVEIMGACYNTDVTTYRYTSSLLGSGDLELWSSDNGGRDQHVGAMAVIPKTAKPGSYSISFVCKGKKVSSSFVVEPAKKAPPKKEAPAKAVPKKEAVKQVAKVPAGAPQTGGTDDPADHTAAFAVAGAAVLAAGGAGFVGYRRRMGKNG
ncbi:hypothetical protein AB5J62_03655 [Amycolatopsis sp. cg5]|uniref:hypothetical protein n=1 Tax=Amycolatopsis sp. cg5 TaxID=3238802 RepID=UPI0035236F4F